MIARFSTGYWMLAITAVRFGQMLRIVTRSLSKRWRKRITTAGVIVEGER
jgi:hypothetical protein